MTLLAEKLTKAFFEEPAKVQTILQHDELPRELHEVGRTLTLMQTAVEMGLWTPDVKANLAARLAATAATLNPGD